MRSLNSQFMEEISKIKDVEIFIGVAHLLGVRLLEEEKDEDGKFLPRDFTDVFEDTIKKFDSAGRKLKRDIVKMVQKANQA